jgi:hypothetical protein
MRYYKLITNVPEDLAGAIYIERRRRYCSIIIDTIYTGAEFTETEQERLVAIGDYYRDNHFTRLSSAARWYANKTTAYFTGFHNDDIDDILEKLCEVMTMDDGVVEAVSRGDKLANDRPDLAKIETAIHREQKPL